MPKNNYIQKTEKKRGFTLIEIMVSISIFTIIITVGMGALLSLTRSYQVSRSRSEVLNALEFSLNSMTRDIRIGDGYTNVGSPGAYENLDPQNRWSDNGNYNRLTFEGAPRRGVVSFQHVDSDDSGFIRRFGDGTIPDAFLSSQRDIDITNMVFRIHGADPNDSYQPSVFIQLRGKLVGQDTDDELIIQTFISQRDLDF